MCIVLYQLKWIEVNGRVNEWRQCQIAVLNLDSQQFFSYILMVLQCRFSMCVCACSSSLETIAKFKIYLAATVDDSECSLISLHKLRNLKSWHMKQRLLQGISHIYCKKRRKIKKSNEPIYNNNQTNGCFQLANKWLNHDIIEWCCRRSGLQSHRQQHSNKWFGFHQCFVFGGFFAFFLSCPFIRKSFAVRVISDNERLRRNRGKKLVWLIFFVSLSLSFVS